MLPVNLNLPFDVEIKAVASSSYTPEHIDRRLAVLRERVDQTYDETRREIAYLEQLKLSQQ